MRMTRQLKISLGQHSDKGCKEINQDFHGVCIPLEPQLSSKGVAIAIADGISSSDVSQVASQAAVSGFLEDYYCTSDAWSVKTSVERVLVATNSWLHSQTRKSHYRHEKDRGYVCTLSAMVIKSTTAHIFHVGDARIYQVREKSLEQLTVDHRVRASADQSYLSRALGADSQLEIDYQSTQVERGDQFLFVTDGVYEHASAGFIRDAIQGHRDDLDQAARLIVEEACRQGSKDNLTVQIVRIDDLQDPQASEMMQQALGLPLPPMLEARQVFDGYRIIREVRGSSRSHIYLAQDIDTDALVIIKTPSIDLQDDTAYLERFMMEEWVARRINSAHVLKPCAQVRRRQYLYVATEFIDGQSLAQWIIDHPRPELDAVRSIVEQIARGLRAFHRLEMLHQDLKPDNIMIDTTGTVKIIDFGATRVAGMADMASTVERGTLLGEAQYAAPEYFVGESGSARSDLYSLGVVTYQMLTGRLPYGIEVARCRTPADLRKLKYRSIREENPAVPAWIDEAVGKAVHPDPQKRHEALSEFVHDLRHPNKGFLNRHRPALIERSPAAFWKGVSCVLAVVILMLMLSRSFKP